MCFVALSSQLTIQLYVLVYPYICLYMDGLYICDIKGNICIYMYIDDY